MTAAFVRVGGGKLINLAFVKEASAEKQYTKRVAPGETKLAWYRDLTLSDDTTVIVDESELRDALVENTATCVPAEPGTYLIDYRDGKLIKEAPVVAWKIHDEDAEPISPLWTWQLKEKGFVILFPDGRVTDIHGEQTWESVAEFEKEMAETDVRPKEDA